MTHGPSIIQLIEHELDGAVVRAAQGERSARDVALGLATALAILYNPYNPSIDEQRQAAKLRYQENRRRGNGARAGARTR